MICEPTPDFIHPNSIGLRNERSLHGDIRSWYAMTGDQFEVPIDGSIIDIVRGDLLIEIQTRNLGKLKHKITRLLQSHPVRLIYPIALHKWIVKQDAEGNELSRRRSPKKGNPSHIFNELIHIPQLIKHPNFSLEVLLIDEEEVRCDDGKGSWRRKRISIADRRLLGVQERVLLASPADYRTFLPANLAMPFSVKELASAAKWRPAFARKAVYALRHIGLLNVCGKRGNELLCEPA